MKTVSIHGLQCNTDSHNTIGVNRDAAVPSCTQVDCGPCPITRANILVLKGNLQNLLSEKSTGNHNLEAGYEICHKRCRFAAAKTAIRVAKK